MLLSTVTRPREIVNLIENKIDFLHDLLYGNRRTGWNMRILTGGMEEAL